MNFLRTTVAALSAAAIFLGGAVADEGAVNVNFANIFKGLDLTKPTCEPCPTCPTVPVCAEQQSVLFGSGSSSVGYILPQLIREFNKAHPTISVAYSEPGSGQGVIAAGEKIAHFGMGSRAMKSSEKTAYPAVGELVFAVAPVVLAINTDSLPAGVQPALTKAQIINIFNGVYTKWSDVDGSWPAVAIHPIVRESGASVRDVFEDFVGKFAYPGTATEYVDSDPQVAAIANGAGAITYTTISNVESWKAANPALANKIVFASVDGGAPTVDSIKAGTYPLVRSYTFLSQDKAAPLAANFATFIHFINTNAAAQKIISDNKWVPRQMTFLSL